MTLNVLFFELVVMLRYPVSLVYLRYTFHSVSDAEDVPGSSFLTSSKNT